jgi:hypothetical protein
MMKPGNSHRPEKGALEIIEEASQLLRLAPVGILFRYYLGTLPFVLGFLLFWVDMSYSGIAGPRLVRASLGLAVLFLWMKCWQAVFASNLRSFLEDAPQPSWTPGRILTLVCVQSAVTPWTMILLPLALLITLPFGWCYAFFQNMVIFGDGELELKASMRGAWQQCSLWPGQNHKIILIFFLLAIFVYLNVCIAAVLIPKMLKAFLGIETVFSRNDLFFLNTTFLLSMAGIMSLCVNPLIRAAYVLRCFYGESLSSGRDLLSEWRRLRQSARHALVLVVAIPAFTLFVPGGTTAVETQPQQTSVQAAPGISAEKLDRALSDVMGRLEYSWRFPHEKGEEQKDSGFLGQALTTLGGWLKTAWGWLKAALDRFYDWLGRLVPEGDPKNSGDINMFGNVKLWLILLFSAAVLIGLWLLRKMWHRAKPAAQTSGEERLPTHSEADLRDENTSADQLPEARWLELGKTLLNDGELRLALRAFYFAALAHLADQNLLTLSRFKSNRDYEREIKRRAHSFPGMVGAFSENLVIFERIWYGIHSIRQETVQQFLNNYKRITADDQVR